ncbi:MAG: hypothetical protein R6V05_05735 [Candidatus Brocadiia bacterium]
MDQPFTVVVCTPDVDAALAAAVAGRVAEGRAEALVFSSDELPAFFESEAQRRLPRGYDLTLCGHQVVHVDWDGRLVRPVLMKRLRQFVGLVRWFGREPWQPEDRRALEHMIGAENLVIAETGVPLAEVLLERAGAGADEYVHDLARCGAGNLSDGQEREWGAELRRVLTYLKADRQALGGVVGELVEANVEGVVEEHAEQARQREQQVRSFAEANADDVRPMGSRRLVTVPVPRDKHAFWAETGAFARAASEAQLSLCHLQGRLVMVLAREADLRADLRSWARYVTDLMPEAQTVGARPDTVPLVVDGLDDDPDLLKVVLDLLADGAHLLRE